MSSEIHIDVRVAEEETVHFDNATVNGEPVKDPYHVGAHSGDRMTWHFVNSESFPGYRPSLHFSSGNDPGSGRIDALSPLNLSGDTKSGYKLSGTVATKGAFNYWVRLVPEGEAEKSFRQLHCPYSTSGAGQVTNPPKPPGSG